MTHEHGKRYPASDPPTVGDYPILTIDKEGKHFSFEASEHYEVERMLAHRPTETWQRIQLAPMAGHEPYKPWWADKVEMNELEPTLEFYVSASVKDANADGLIFNSRAKAIRIWNAMMDPNSPESEREWAREYIS